MPKKAIPWRWLMLLMLPATAFYLWQFRALDDFRLAHLWTLPLFLLAMVLVVWLGIFRQRKPTLVHSQATQLGALPKGYWARLRSLPIALRLFGLLLLAMAIARPQSSRREDRMEVEGIDMVVTLDLSGSMEERDLVPNRLEAAKTVIEDFIKRRPSDRIGTVIFGRDAYTYSPLTLDHSTLLRMLAELQPGIIDGRGTAIGNGLGVALARLRKSDARSKVVILLTDGDNNSGNISPTEAASMAQTLGVRVYTILAGSHESGREAESDPNTRRYPVNPKLLEEIASKTGGAPYLATDTQALHRRFQSILEDLDKSQIKDRGVSYAELYPFFLWPGLLALLLELALRLTRLRRLP